MAIVPFRFHPLLVCFDRLLLAWHLVGRFSTARLGLDEDEVQLALSGQCEQDRGLGPVVAQTTNCEKAPPWEWQHPYRSAVNYIPVGVKKGRRGKTKLPPKALTNRV